MEKKHWYSFSYTSYGDTRACTYTGYHNMGVTKSMIEENKRYAGVPADAVLFSVCYLGEMTKEAFENE